MSYHLQELSIPNKTHFYKEESGKNSQVIRNISKINIFIGPNNSGKSKLLRDILQNKIQYKPKNFSTEKLVLLIAGLKKEFDDYYKKIKVPTDKKFETIFSKLQIPEFVDDTFELNAPLTELKNAIKRFQDDKSTSYRGITYFSQVGNELMPIFEKYNLLIEKELDYDLFKTEFIKIYVPILRGLRPISGTKDEPKYIDFYRDRTLYDYFPNVYINEDPEFFHIQSGKEPSKTDEKFLIFTGLSAFDTIKKYLLGTLQERKLVRDYEEYLSKIFFDGKSIAIIPSEKTNILTLKIGDEIEQPIYNQGDGLQSIIISTLPLFLHRGENVLFFIDEPEKLLHPGLQRKLIETLLEQDGFENYQFFITTHSNHFLDITLDFQDISIFTFKKMFNPGDKSEERVPQFILENVSFGDRSALELLGVRNSSIFLSNCTIWVEGITDRLYFKHYLELYQQYLLEQKKATIKFKEDFHFSFVEFGGANITHFSFLSSDMNPVNVERLCGRSFVITDRDIGSKKTRDELKRKLGERCFILKSAEVENLLTKPVLLSVIEEYEGEKLDIVDFSERDYREVYLGKFIEDKIRNKKRRGPYQQESGTITDKIGFCRKALKKIEKWDELSSEAKQITEKIYTFIELNNPS